MSTNSANKKIWVDNEYGLWHNAILIDELDK